MNIVYDCFFARNIQAAQFSLVGDYVNATLPRGNFNNTTDNGTGSNEGKNKGGHNLVAGVKATRIFVMCCLQNYVDAPDSKRHKGAEANSEGKDVVVHDTVSQEGIGVPLFQTNTPGLVSSLS